MPRHARVAESAFPAIEAAWNMDPQLLYRAWMNQATRMRDETVRFAQEQFTKELDAVVRLARCTNPSEVFAVQADYANTLATDYVEEGKKLVELMGGMAAELSSVPKAHRAHHS